MWWPCFPALIAIFCDSLAHTQFAFVCGGVTLRLCRREHGHIRLMYSLSLYYFVVAIAIWALGDWWMRILHRNSIQVNIKIVFIRSVCARVCVCACMRSEFATNIFTIGVDFHQPFYITIYNLVIFVSIFVRSTNSDAIIWTPLENDWIFCRKWRINCIHTRAVRLIRSKHEPSEKRQIIKSKINNRGRKREREKKLKWILMLKRKAGSKSKLVSDPINLISRRR